MEVLTLRLAARHSGLRARLRDAALCPAPGVAGLRARHWHATDRWVFGRYLFDARANLDEFATRPDVDPAFTLLASGSDEKPVWQQIERIATSPAFDPPVFIISAPRAGSTMLFDLLAHSANFWTIGRESEGVIEGISELHPANRGFHSHRLDSRDADAKTVEALHAGFIAEIHDRRGGRFLELQEQERPRRILLLEKTPENALRVPFLAAAFPGARFLFVHRDPRQNVSSILEAWHHSGFVNISNLPGWERRRWHFLLPEGWRDLQCASLLELAAFQWDAANQCALDDLECLAADQWIVIDYAEVVRAPYAVARKVCDFTRLPMDEHLSAALARPLPIAATSISPPSSIKWRSNREFHESVLERYRSTIDRLHNLDRRVSPPPDVKES
jgi:hypothetical protein